VVHHRLSGFPGESVTASAEQRLLRLAVDLGAEACGGPLSAAEQQLLATVRDLLASTAGGLAAAASAIQQGADPLGREFSRLRSAAERRPQGQFYTPPELVDPMVAWVLDRAPARVVDAGCGSGRFAAAVARRAPGLPVIAVDRDPWQTIMTRATLKVLGADRASVVQADYTRLALPAAAGRTAFIGNPPYVRHHDLTAAAKQWAVRAARELGLRLSTLAGLHVYFYLATALAARPGDVGCFVTSAEWLDVNYGAALRRLFLGRLGGQALHLLDPRAVPFADAMTTAVTACFVVESSPSAVHLRALGSLADLGYLEGGTAVSPAELARSGRWSTAFAARDLDATGARPLGAIARVHRGLVTGANDYFLLTRDDAAALGLRDWCHPAITTAAELFAADGVIRDGPERRLLLDVPPDVDRSAHPRLDAYLRRGEASRRGQPPIAQRYIPTHRRPWWYLGRWRPAPIIASYMARQAPRFVLNPDGLAIINVMHGLYPRHELSWSRLATLTAALNQARHSFRGNGRTYHGGLEKIEPREMEALRLPEGDWD
jgi:adenine-specific DNA-methyltransferase